MIVSIALAMMFAEEIAPADEAPTAVVSEQAAPAADEVEICRRKMVDDPRAAGRKRAKKICKTAEEWKEFVARRT